jgi:hypothetical protein
MKKGTLEMYNKVLLLFVTTSVTCHPPKDGDGGRYKQGDWYSWHRADNHCDKSEMWL